MPPSRRRSKAASAAVDPLAEYRRALGYLNSAQRSVAARIERAVKKHDEDAVFLAFEDNRVLKLYSCGLRCRHCAICKCGVAAWREPANDTTIRFLTPFNWCADAPEDYLLSTFVDVLRRMDSVPSIVILSVPRGAVERLRLLILGLAFVMDHTRIREMHVFLASGGDAGYHYQRLSAAMDAQNCRTVQEVAALALPDEMVRTTTVRAPLFKLVDIVATLETEPLEEPATAFVLARNGEGEVTYRTRGFMPESMWAEGARGAWGKRLETMLKEYEERAEGRNRDAPQQSQKEQEEASLLPLFAPPAPPSSLTTALEPEIKQEVMEEDEEEEKKEEGEGEQREDSLQKSDDEGDAAAGGGGAEETAEKTFETAAATGGDDAAAETTAAAAAAATAGAGAVEQKGNDSDDKASAPATGAGTGAVAVAIKKEPEFVQFDFGPSHEQILKAAAKPAASSTTPPRTGGVPAADELLQPPAKKQRKQPPLSKLESALEAAMQLQQASASAPGSDVGASTSAAAAVAAISPEQREALAVATAADAAEHKKRALRPRKETPRALSVPGPRYRWGANPQSAAASRDSVKKESSVASSAASTAVKEEKKEAMVEVKKEEKKKGRGRPRKDGKEAESGDEEEEEEEQDEGASYGAVVVFKKARHSAEGRRAMAAKLAPAAVDVAGRVRSLCEALEENGDATEALLEQWQRIGKAMQPRRKTDTLLAALQEISAAMPPVGLSHPVVDPDCWLHD